MEELVTRKYLDDHIRDIVISWNLQHLDFSMFAYLSDEMQPHIDVIGSFMIGWIIWRMYGNLTIIFSSDNLTLKFKLICKTFKPQCFFHNFSEGNILRFNSWYGNNLLKCCFPTDCYAKHNEHVSKNRFYGIHTTCIIIIDKSFNFDFAIITTGSTINQDSS